MKYRRRPVEVEAVQWNGQPVSELPEWASDAKPHCAAMPGDWFIKRAGDGYVSWATDTEFLAAYEPMEG